MKKADEPTPHVLIGFLEDALSDAESARVEQLLRTDDRWREALRELRDRTDLGEHSVSMVWRRHRLSCLDRETLWAFTAGALAPDVEEYAKFHVRELECPWCVANLRDLEEATAAVKVKAGGDRQRGRRFFETSVGHLPKNFTGRG